MRLKKRLITTCLRKSGSDSDHQQLDDTTWSLAALGRSDYTTELPLREVLLIARHCSGGIHSWLRAVPS